MKRFLAAMLLAAVAAAGPAAAQGGAGEGWLGISWRPAGDAMVVADVFPGSPADRAGLLPGDTVLRWNGSPAADAARESRPAAGEEVRLRVRRGAERDRELAVVAESRPARVAARVPGPGDRVVLGPDRARRIHLHADSLRVHADSLHSRLRGMLLDSLGPRVRVLRQRGLPALRDLAFDPDLGARSAAGAEFAEINPGLAAYFRTDRGALVLRVAPETPAARAGLQAGDVVVRAGSADVSSVADLRRALARRTRDAGLILEVVRRGERVELRM